MWKQFLRDYFNFTRKERKGIIIIAVTHFNFYSASFFLPVIYKAKAIYL